MTNRIYKAKAVLIFEIIFKGGITVSLHSRSPFMNRVDETKAALLTVIMRKIGNTINSSMKSIR
jgi:metal-dependent HD superfamily phosphatase/phosphodiesterase